MKLVYATEYFYYGAGQGSLGIFSTMQAAMAAVDHAIGDEYGWGAWSKSFGPADEPEGSEIGDRYLNMWHRRLGVGPGACLWNVMEYEVREAA